MKYLGVVLVLLIALLVVYRLRRPAAQPLADDIDALMAAHADDAVRRAEAEFGTHLDYTPASDQQVEAILADLHDRHKHQPLGERELGREARLWGAYLGAVSKRLRPCTWRKDSAAAGEGSLPLVFGERDETFPCAWTYKRIKNGEEDNVTVKFQLLILERDKSPGGLEIKPE
jgi:hypothetical protein